MLSKNPEGVRRNSNKVVWRQPGARGGGEGAKQWFLTFPTPGTPIPKDIGLGTPSLRNLQRKCMLKK